MDRFPRRMDGKSVSTDEKQTDTALQVSTITRRRVTDWEIRPFVAYREFGLTFALPTTLTWAKA